MDWLTDELICYVGLVIALLGGVLAVFSLFLYKLKKEKLMSKYNTEYGEISKRK